MRKLKEEKEKQTAMEERQRATWGKRKLKGRRPAASNSGGESTREPTPVEVGETNPEPTRRMATTGGLGRSKGPLRGAAKPEQRDLGAEPRWREERWRRERGMEHGDRWERTQGVPGWAEDRRPTGERWGNRRGSSPDPRERRPW